MCRHLWLISPPSCGHRRRRRPGSAPASADRGGRALLHRSRRGSAEPGASRSTGGSVAISPSSATAAMTRAIASMSWRLASRTTTSRRLPERFVRCVLCRCRAGFGAMLGAASPPRLVLEVLSPRSFAQPQALAAGPSSRSGRWRSPDVCCCHRFWRPVTSPTSTGQGARTTRT